MGKTELLEREAKPQGYILTKKGLRAARQQTNTMDGAILRMMAKSPDSPVTKDSVSKDFWQKLSDVLKKLEEEGLVELVDPEVQPGKAKVVIEHTGETASLKLPGEAKPKLQKLTKNTYADRKGERFARKKRRGWKPVKY